MKLLQELLSLNESSPDAPGISWMSEIADMLKKHGFNKNEIEQIAKWVDGHIDDDDVDPKILDKVQEMNPNSPLTDVRLEWFHEYMGESVVREGAMKDLHIDLLDAIRNEFDTDDDMTAKIADWLLDGTDDKDVSEFLYNPFVDSGQMPYGTMKARTGDPDNWIADEMSQMFAKQMKAIWATEKTVKEDWGSSDWYAVFSGIERDLKKGVSLEDAIYGMASFYGDSMGYDDIDDAIASIKRIAKARKYEWAMTFESVAARPLKEFAPSDKGDDEDDAFNPSFAEAAKKEGFVKGASLADDQTLASGFEISSWDTAFGGLYKQYFADGWKEGRKDKLAHAIKTYGGSGKLLPNGALKYIPKK